MVKNAMLFKKSMSVDVSYEKISDLLFHDLFGFCRNRCVMQEYLMPQFETLFGKHGHTVGRVVFLFLIRTTHVVSGAVNPCLVRMVSCSFGQRGYNVSLMPYKSF